MAKANKIQKWRKKIIGVIAIFSAGPQQPVIDSIPSKWSPIPSGQIRGPQLTPSVQRPTRCEVRLIPPWVYIGPQLQWMTPFDPMTVWWNWWFEVRSSNHVAKSKKILPNHLDCGTVVFPREYYAVVCQCLQWRPNFRFAGWQHTGKHRASIFNTGPKQRRHQSRA